MQNFYVGETASVVGIIPNINWIANTLRDAGGRVIWIGMSAGKNGNSDWRIYHDHFFTQDKANAHREQLTPGHPGHAFHPKLAVRDGDDIVFKRRFSPFIRGASNLEAVLKAHNIENLIVTGTLTNMCCETTARDAMMLDYKVVMVSDANGARYPEDHLAGLTSFYQSFGDVRTSEEVVTKLLRPQFVSNAAAEKPSNLERS